MRKLYIPLIDVVRPLIVAIVGLALLAGMLTYQLGVMPDGISANEVPVVHTVQANALSGRDILQRNSLYLPHKLGLYALEKSGFTSLRAIRAVGVSFGLLGAIAMYIILRKWHTQRVALLTSLLFVTSSWFLYSARLAAPETTYLLVPWLVYFGIRVQENNLRFLGLGLLMLLVTLILYIPGLCWFIIPAIIWQRSRVSAELRQAGTKQSLLLVAGTLLVLLPLVMTFINDPSLIVDWLGATGPRLSALEFLKNLANIPVQLFARSELDPSTHVGRLPYLDIATTVFVALGAYRYFFRRRLDRTKLLAAGLIVGSLLAALNFQAATILLPFIYIIAAAGITLLLQQWFTVFPRNPLARNIGVGLVVLVVALTGVYHLRRYFIAWPNTPETRQAYSISVKL